MADRHHTIRLHVFEIYEEGSDFPLFITSDSVEAHRELSPTDRVVQRWWVREGATEEEKP